MSSQSEVVQNMKKILEIDIHSLPDGNLQACLHYNLTRFGIVQ